MLKTAQFSQTQMVKDKAAVQAGGKRSNAGSYSSWLFPQISPVSHLPVGQ